MKAFVEMTETGCPPVVTDEARRNFELLKEIDRAMNDVR